MALNELMIMDMKKGEWHTLYEYISHYPESIISHNDTIKLDKS
ncbi:MAG: hypothetical protein NTZ20_00520 [Candidatus Levybacteria bacterium]|nr:hypothetical protein [Candidatus Levybacteria bacterium]